MSTRKPLGYNADGTVEEIPLTDTLDANVSNQAIWPAKNANAGSITLGMVVYVKTAGTTDVDLAKADAKSTSKPTIGLVADATIVAAATGNIQTSGPLNSADWTAVIGATNLTKGSEYFVDLTTAGMLTATAPTASGKAICKVGVALDTTHLDIGIEFRGMRA